MLHDSYSSFLVCNYTLTPTSNRFSSPGYPNKYPNNAYCEYHFKVPEGRVVKIYSTYFSLESSAFCTKDSVNLYEKNILKARLCGSLPSRTWISNETDVLMVFKSDASVTSNGFYGYFFAVIKRKSAK